jgi:hypothetical protein
MEVAPPMPWQARLWSDANFYFLTVVAQLPGLGEVVFETDYPSR